MATFFKGLTCQIYWKLKELIPPTFQWLKVLLPQTFSQVHRKFVFETENDPGCDSRYLGNTGKGTVKDYGSRTMGQAVGKLLFGLLWASKLTPQKSLPWHFLTWKCFNSLLLANYPQGLHSRLALCEAHVWFDGLWQACLAKKKSCWAQHSHAESFFCWLTHHFQRALPRCTCITGEMWHTMRQRAEKNTGSVEKRNWIGRQTPWISALH